MIWFVFWMKLIKHLIIGRKYMNKTFLELAQELSQMIDEVKNPEPP